MSPRRTDGAARYVSEYSISRRQLLAASGFVAVGGLAGCLGRVASVATNSGATPAAAFAGVGESELYPSRHSNTYRLSPVIRVDEGPLSGDVELEAWVTGQVTTEDYDTPRSNRSAARPDELDSDSDDDGVDDGGDDVREAALELERELLGEVETAAESISKRSARTGRNPETDKPITESLDDMDGIISEVQATLERCSADVCVTVLENADHRTRLVQQARGHVDNEEWDEAAAAAEKVQEIVEADIERLENAVGGEREALVEYLIGSPVVGERFTVCLPDAEVPGGNGSLAEEVTPQRFIDYVTGRAAGDGDGKLYAWGNRPSTASGNGGANDCDDSDSPLRPGDVCTPTHLESAVSAPTETGGSLDSTRASDGTVIVVNDPPRAEAGVSVLVCPADGEAYEPSGLSEWGSESGASAETPTIVCQVLVQPPECPEPFPALLYVKRCRSDGQLIYTGGWVTDKAALYEESVTMLTVAGETQVVGVEAVVDGECCFDYNDVVLRSLSSERARRGARLESGSVNALIEAGVLSDDRVIRKRPGRLDGASGDHGGEVVVTHCPLDCPVFHLVNAGSASDEVKFKAGAELSKSVN
ncbi:MAG: hypothetical protein ACQET5_10685 [Halobacteriota archaeon]